MISIKKNPKPDLAQCKFLCDVPLDKKLDAYPLMQFMNKHSTNLFVGRPGSGKTSFLYSLFASKSLLKSCYHNIYLFQPSQSRSSMSHKIFDQLDDDKKFDELTQENLSDGMQRIKTEESEYNNCIIFDDVGAYLRDDPGVRNLLKELLMNKRHYHTSVFMLTQSWKSSEPTLRKLFDNIFIWKVSKNEMANIFDEVFEGKKDNADKIVKITYDEPYNFLMINVNTQRFFKNWDEIIVSDN
jgi:hypothetical protein